MRGIKQSTKHHSHENSLYLVKMFRKHHENKCVKKLKKESENRSDIDIIPNWPVTFETDVSNYKDNFDTICANFLGQWCEAEIRRHCPKEEKLKIKTGSKRVTQQQSETKKKSSTLDKVEKVNNYILAFT